MTYPNRPGASHRCIPFLDNAMIRNRSLAFALLTATVGVSACDSLTGSSTGSPIGVGGLSARTKGAGFTTAPQLAFYRVSGATFESAAGVRDTCYLAAYSESSTTGGSPGTSTTTGLGAGAFIMVAIGNRVDSLTRTGGALDPVYRSSLSGGIPYTPGDSMVITIPGDRTGFPMSSFRGRTAEPFTMGQLGVPQLGSPVNITWTPATDPNAAMFVTFRYVSGLSSALPFNRQIACSFIDDGSAQVSAAVSADWTSSIKHDMVAQRIRTILAQVAVPLSYFNIVSTFDWPTPISP